MRCEPAAPILAVWGASLVFFCGWATAAPDTSRRIEQRNLTLDQLGRAMSPDNAQRSSTRRRQGDLRTWQLEEQQRRQGLPDPRRTEPFTQTPEPLSAPRLRRQRQLEEPSR